MNEWMDITPKTIYFSRDAKNKCICSICLAPLRLQGDLVTYTMCGHAFHYKCMNGWIRCHYESSSETVKCPVCQGPATTLVTHHNHPASGTIQLVVGMIFLCFALLAALVIGIILGCVGCA